MQIVISGPDEYIEKKGYCIVDDGYPLVEDKALYVDAGFSVPFKKLPFAERLLDKWDAAVPLGGYGVLAQDVGDAGDRDNTLKLVGDLRVPVHTIELLFIGYNTVGRDLLKCYKEEIKKGSNRRLAFIRANYIVKPKLCVLPRIWVAKAKKTLPTQKLVRGGLVEVEIEPGRFVRCHPGDEEKVVKMLTGGRR